METFIKGNRKGGVMKIYSIISDTGETFGSYKTEEKAKEELAKIYVKGYLMAHYNLSSEQFDRLDALVIHGLWERMTQSQGLFNITSTLKRGFSGDVADMLRGERDFWKNQLKGV